MNQMITCQLKYHAQLPIILEKKHMKIPIQHGYSAKMEDLILRETTGQDQLTQKGQCNQQPRESLQVCSLTEEELNYHQINAQNQVRKSKRSLTQD